MTAPFATDCTDYTDWMPRAYAGQAWQAARQECDRDRVIHERLSGSIIGAAMTVLSELRPGLQEKLYENALVMELTSRGHRIAQQRSFPVHYKGHFVGKLIPDLIVDDAVIVDTKAVTTFSDTTSVRWSDTWRSPAFGSHSF
jgi:GxxExxY protein